MEKENKNPWIKQVIVGFTLLMSLFLLGGFFPDRVFANPVLPDSPQGIPLYTYHTHPPFIIETGRGLSYDLAAYLSGKSNGYFRFFVKPMSRPRVNKMIAESKKGIVPWVNPVWFKDKQEKKYMWSKGSLMEDGNALISHQKRKIVYDGPPSLDGLIFGGVRAHVYTGLDDYIKGTGLLHRVDAENHLDNFRKLIKQRIDATITPRSGAEYLIKKEGFQGQLFISPKPHSIYKRRVIIINRLAEMRTFVDAALKDPQWIEILKRYQ